MKFIKKLLAVVALSSTVLCTVSFAKTYTCPPDQFANAVFFNVNPPILYCSIGGGYNITFEQGATPNGPWIPDEQTDKHVCVDSPETCAIEYTGNITVG